MEQQVPALVLEEPLHDRPEHAGLHQLGQGFFWHDWSSGVLCAKGQLLPPALAGSLIW
jgi:hypothetical protein